MIRWTSLGDRSGDFHSSAIEFVIMQTFILVPFFLNISLPADFYVRRFGPEYVYDVEVTVTRWENYYHDQSYFHVASTLRCVPLELTLYCHLDNFIKTEHNMQFVSGRNYRQLSPIHIIFDAKGITYLYVPPHHDTFSTNIVRAIVGQFNTGVYLPTSYVYMTNSFVAQENSYICKCMSHVNITRSNLKSKAPSNKELEIVSIPRLNLTSVPVMITKWRDLKHTVRERDKGKYMFWSVQEYWPNITLMQSQGTIRISRDKFESYNANVFNIKTASGKWTFHENIRLRLLSVEPGRNIGPSFDTVDDYLHAVRPFV